MSGGLRGLLRPVRDAARRIAWAGDQRVCPVCGQSARAFAPFGPERRREAQCVHCGALERHRLVWMWLERSRLLEPPGQRLLHVAPEPCLTGRLRARIGVGYVTTDRFEAAVDVRSDVAALPHPDRRFDLVYCSHVLEHVEADRAALREFRRVLTPAGRAILMVPITSDHTLEDPSVVTAAGRLARYGQSDHVRRYGPDFAERVRDAGFELEIVTAANVANPAERLRHGLTAAAGDVYVAQPG